MAKKATVRASKIVPLDFAEFREKCEALRAEYLAARTPGGKIRGTVPGGNKTVDVSPDAAQCLDELANGGWLSLLNALSSAGAERRVLIQAR